MSPSPRQRRELIERFISSSQFRVREAAYGRHKLSDHGIRLELAWMSETPESYLFELRAGPSEDGAELKSELVELQDGLASFDQPLRDRLIILIGA